MSLTFISRRGLPSRHLLKANNQTPVPRAGAWDGGGFNGRQGWGARGIEGTRGEGGHCDILLNRELCTVKESHQMTRSEQYTRSAFIDCRVEGT